MRKPCIAFTVFVEVLSNLRDISNFCVRQLHIHNDIHEEEEHAWQYGAVERIFLMLINIKKKAKEQHHLSHDMLGYLDLFNYYTR